jgi:urease accessory protein
MTKNNKVESILLTLNESEKLRMRKVSYKGTGMALTMPARSCLNDGDVVFLNDEKMMIVK